MKKRLLALLLAGTMVFSLCACGSGNNGTTDPTATPAPTKEASNPADPTPTPVPADPTATPTPVPVDTITFTGSPTLTGNVEDRLPVKDDIYVSQVDAAGNPLEIGTYGGVINLLNGGGSWDLSRPITESIIRYNTDGSYSPNVIKAYEHSDDYREWTFYLREGMKWSDGNDFNADDITFWYYMCHLTNFDGKKSWAALKETVNGEDAWATLTKIDETTVKWTFVNPKFPADFIENGDFKWCWAPSHYLNDLIPASIYVENEYWENTGLTDDQVLLNAKAKGIDQATIKDLGKFVSYNFWNASGVPTVNSFVLTTKEGNNSKDDTLCILERNAYYWKVDAKGQQLPYCDAIYMNRTSEEGQDLLMFRSGELDILGVAMQDIASLLADLGDAAYLTTYQGSNWGSYQITFNYTNTDPNYANLFNNIKFREAMSICVDREQVSGLLSDGFLEPGQACPSEGLFGYDPEWETKWTTYDVAAAKKLLEECGLVMGDDGFYNFADGSDLVIVFYMYQDSGAADAYPVLEQYFNAAGIKCAPKEAEVGTFDQDIDNNNWIAVMGPHTSLGGLSLRDRVAPFVPIAEAAEWYGEFGAYYQTGGAEGVQPTGDMAKLVEIYEKWNATPDTAERDAYSLEIYEVLKENIWTIAYLKAAGNYNLVSSKIKNYPENLVWADLYMYANMVHFENLYKAE